MRINRGLTLNKPKDVASGITGLTAVARQHERSVLVLLALLPGLWVFFLLVGEFLSPTDRRYSSKSASERT